MAGSDNLKPWQPGQSGNPEGRKPVPIELKSLNKTEFAAQIWKTFNYTVEELTKIATNRQSKVSDAWLASSALKGIARGDFKALDWFCTRLGLPKLVEHLDVTVRDGDPIESSMRDRMIRMVLHSGLLEDPEIRKQVIDVTPQPQNNQESK